MDSKDETIIAIVYDFDKTLSTADMQTAFINDLGMRPGDFWDMVKEFSRENGMDNIISYMYVMMKEREKEGRPLDRETLKKFGKDIEFHPGVEQWFEAVNSHAESIGVKVEHYIISSGLREIIEGTPIYRYFKNVFACEYLYEDGRPVWAKEVVNFTTKTQFLFRINKEEPDVWDSEGVNKYQLHGERRIPFENMVYIGDGTTDIPCMKLVREYGGCSIGVYAEDPSAVRELMYDDRINVWCRADYTPGKELYRVVTDKMSEIKYGHPLRRLSCRQFREAEEEMNRTESGCSNLER